ncbi:hypothetical protein M3194_15980 [Paenibacillus glycanilyticus]|uniref:hypothetical protein n=1 Tax=Paenibacillus glycanilyticus TaxID=126569 RepID=UPI00203E77D4|nr:hypothetical protein [Paenibacillus glycanilyticus]MCM3628843.1 hypothetical protein [Paenibacillus glycanilyticus]
MFIAQRVLGYAAILFGVFMIFSSAFVQGAVFAAAGFVLISLAELVRLQQGTYHLALGLPLKNEQINDIMRRTPPSKVTSSSLNIHPFDGAEYPLIRLHGESYIRAKVFVPYIVQTEMEYRFAFPNAEPVLLICEPRYSLDSRLFQYNEQVYVKLSELPLKYQTEGDRLRMEIAARQHQL